jgi:hypothetical protein
VQCLYELKDMEKKRVLGQKTNFYTFDGGKRKIPTVNEIATKKSTSTDFQFNICNVCTNLKIWKRKKFWAKRPTSTPSTEEKKIPTANEIATKKSTSTDLQFSI